jgi:tetratricopeptide (TPR) repeat protein
LDCNLDSAIELQKSGHLNEAEACYRDILEQSSDSSEVRFLLAVLLLDRNDLLESFDLLSRAIQLDPEIPDYLMLRGDLNFLRDDLVAAITDYEQAKILAPFNPSVYCGLGTIYIEADKLDEAEIEFSYLINRQPGNFDAGSGLSRIACKRGQKIFETSKEVSEAKAKLAHKYFATAIAHDIANAEAILGMAESLIFLNHVDQVTFWLLKYIALGQDCENLSLEAQTLLFIEILHQDNPILFRQVISAMIKSNGGALPRLNDKNWQRMKLTLSESKNREPAQNYLNALFNAAQAGTEELLELAKIESASGNCKKALRLTLAATEQTDFKKQHSGIAGRLLFENGKPDQAKAHLLTALHYAPNDEHSLLLMSKVCRNLGETVKAAGYLKALENIEYHSKSKLQFFDVNNRLRDFVTEFRQRHPFPIDIQHPNNTLIHYHIGRSGGIALRSALKRLIPPEHYYSCSEGTREPPIDQLARFNAAPDNFERSIRMAYTHHYLPVHTALNQKFSYFTFFRDPIERLVSQFYLARNRNQDDPKVRSFNIFVDWYSEHGEHNSWTNSIICLNPPTRQTEEAPVISKFDRARSFVDQKFSFIGINTYFQQSLFILCMLIGADAVCTIGRENTSPGKRDAIIDRATRAKIETIFDLDLKFYELYANRFVEEYADALKFE